MKYKGDRVNVFSEYFEFLTVAIKLIGSR